VVRFEIFQRVWSLEPEIPGDPEKKKLEKKWCFRRLWVAEYSDFFCCFPLCTIDRHFFEFFKKEFTHQLRYISFTTTNHSFLSYLDWIFAVSFCTWQKDGRIPGYFENNIFHSHSRHRDDTVKNENLARAELFKIINSNSQNWKTI
jgi:hypothetical protein